LPTGILFFLIGDRQSFIRYSPTKECYLELPWPRQQTRPAPASPSSRLPS
jgi:hypothetical protein